MDLVKARLQQISNSLTEQEVNTAMEAPRFLLFVLFNVKILVPSPLKVQNKTSDTFRQGKFIEYFEKILVQDARLKLWNFNIPD